MFAIFVIALIVYAGLGMTTATVQNQAAQKEYATQVRTNSASDIALAIEAYRAQTGAYPESLSALGLSPGFEAARAFPLNYTEYRLTGDLVDGQSTFRRAGFYLVKPGQSIANQSFFDANSCGTTPFANAAAWCPPRGVAVAHWVGDARPAVAQEIAGQRLRMVRTLQRLANFYNAAGTFPNQTFNGTAIILGDNNLLGHIAGYSGSASSCSGIYQITYVALGCEDLFDLWGNPITYRLVSAKNVQLISTSPFRDHEGMPVLVAQELDAEV